MGDVTLDLVEADDWVIFAVDGEIAYEGHSMSAEELLRQLEKRKGLLDGCRVRRCAIEERDVALGVLPVPGRDKCLSPELESRLG